MQSREPAWHRNRRARGSEARYILRYLDEYSTDLLQWAYFQLLGHHSVCGLSSAVAELLAVQSTMGKPGSGKGGNNKGTSSSSSSGGKGSSSPPWAPALAQDGGPSPAWPWKCCGVTLPADASFCPRCFTHLSGHFEATPPWKQR